MINLISSGTSIVVRNLERKWRQPCRRLRFDAGLLGQTVEEMLQLGLHVIGRRHLFHQPVLVKDANVDILAPISVQARRKDSAAAGNLGTKNPRDRIGYRTHVLVSFGRLALQ